MSGEVDYYDVQAMIRDALIEHANEWRRETDRLERELQELRRETYDSVNSLERVLASRTEHLV